LKTRKEGRRIILCSGDIRGLQIGNTIKFLGNIMFWGCYI